MTQTELDTLVETLNCEYAAELAKMKKTPDYTIGLTKRQIDDLKAGFADGVRGTLGALRTKGITLVSEEGK